MGLPAQTFFSGSTDSQASLFEPDVVLPSQYFGTRKIGLKGGERRLMAALLSDGIEAYILLCTARKSTERTDDQEWVETPNPDYVFSFDNVCECLGIDAEYLRLGLKKYVAAAMLQGDASAKVWKKIRRPRKR